MNERSPVSVDLRRNRN